MHAQFVQDSKDGAVLRVLVQPKASQTACVARHGDELKIRVAAPPIDGAANEELIRYLAGTLMIPRTAFRIESGAGSRHKRVLIRGIAAQAVTARLIQKGLVV